MKKLVKTIIIFFGLLIPVGYISANNEGSVIVFPGLGHDYEGCHNDQVTFSPSGTIELTASSGNTISPGSEFTISATISGFTEVIAGDNATLGFSSSRSDNSEFVFTPNYEGIVDIDASGNSATIVFTVTAPSTEGDYVLTADALNDPLDDDSDDPLLWTYGSIAITVSNATGNGVDPFRSLYMISGTMAGVGLVVTLVFLSVSFVKKSKLSKERVLLGIKK